MKRHESRNIRRRRKMVEVLNPCTRYQVASGKNPFAYLLASLGASRKLDNVELTEEERQEQHRVKMASEQKSARARQNRKRNKV